jgi:hypothetical protein
VEVEMSVVVAAQLEISKSWVLMADSAGMWDGSVRTDARKLFQIGSLRFGSVGPAKNGVMLYEFLRGTDHREYRMYDLMRKFYRETPECDKDTCSFLLIRDKECYLVNGMDVSEPQRYQAIGCGRKFALAALELGHSAEQAVRVACKLSEGCREPIVSMTSASTPPSPV